MSTTDQRLATRGSFDIEPLSALNVQSGIVDKDGQSLIPNFVQIDEDCNLKVIAKNADGSFDVFNPDPFQKTANFRAHHMHSVEQEPIYNVGSATTGPSSAPIPDCVLIGGFPLAVAHQRFSSEQDQTLPASPAFFVPNFSNILTNQDNGAAPNVSFSGGRMIINRSGAYRIRAAMPTKQDAGQPVRVDMYLVSDPDGSPTVIPPASSSDTLAQAEATYPTTSEFSITLAIDDTAPVAQRTFEVRASSTGGIATQGDGVVGASLEVVKIGEKRP